MRTSAPSVLLTAFLLTRVVCDGNMCAVWKDCKAIKERGVTCNGRYTIYPDGKEPLKVLCDMHTDGGGWIVFQRRSDGSVDFHRNWESYKTGFGTKMNEFWLGNDNLHKLTSSGAWELRVDLEDFQKNRYFAKYSSFKVLGEKEKYKLLLGAYTEGNAGDSLKYHNNMNFSTKDQDNDIGAENCALVYRGGWWYKSCHNVNVNGKYLVGDNSSIGINWYTAREPNNYSFKFTEMKIRSL